MPQALGERKALQEQQLNDLLDSTQKDDQEIAQQHADLQETAKLAGTGFVLLGVAIGPLIFIGMVILGVLIVWAVRGLMH